MPSQRFKGFPKHWGFKGLPSQRFKGFKVFKGLERLEGLEGLGGLRAGKRQAWTPIRSH